MGKVPARYIGHHAVSLNPGMGPYYHPDGTRRTEMLLSTGDELLMEESEVLGQSYLFDPKGQRDPLYLGVGRVVLPEHKDLDAQTLAERGYEFHAGRPDMEVILPPHEQTLHAAAEAFTQGVMPHSTEELPSLGLVRDEVKPPVSRAEEEEVR